MRKNFISIWALIILICLLGLAACTAKDPLTPEDRAWLQKKGVLNIGVFKGYPPFGFVDQDGKPVGMSIDYWNLLAQKLKINVKFHPVTFVKQLKGLESGEFDSLAGIFPMPDRQKTMDFTRSFYSINTSLFVAPDLKGIRSLKDLPDIAVGVVEGDSSQDLAQKANLKTQVFTGYEETVMALATDKVKAIILDEPVLAYYIKTKGLEGKIRKVPQLLMQGWMTLPVKEGNSQLLEILDKGIAEVSPKEWRAIEEKWVGRAK
ncbi:MAG: transporter substrate-binding domain-containing protein [Syntrophales bacterium]|nr:transporter substrate-binding domain-containing protein [Syntrophales bacterium]MDD5641143.1 transporter substrate-binding domain-containing protein [Syntrophales bacterium]